MSSSWDPTHLWKQSLKVLRISPPSSQVQPAATQEAIILPPAAATGASGDGSSLLLSSKNLLFILGAGAAGGALVALILHSGDQIHCPSCGCNCHKLGLALHGAKNLFRRISTALEAGCERIQLAAGISSRIDINNTNNNGSWTCIQASRDDGTSTTEVEEIVGGEVVLPDPYSSAKRKGYLSWDDYFMSIAFLSAQRSKDPIRQVGACLVSQDYVILGIGYNGFPRGCSDDKLPWAKKSKDDDPLKTKYPYVCHAEVNAILNKNHASATGQRLYVTMFPCNECAKIIIQAGIVEVVYYTEKQAHSDFKFAASKKLLSLANVKVRQHQPKDKSIILKF